MIFRVTLDYRVNRETDAINIQQEILNYINKGLQAIHTELYPANKAAEESELVNE
jgi:hypothetical protein